MSLSLFGTPRRPAGRSRTPAQTPMKGIRFPSQTPPPIHHDDLQPLVSYHSVHAHLPSATTSSSSYPTKVKTYDFPYAQLNIEEDDMDMEREDAARRFHPEHALSVAYSPSCATLARVINNGKMLELRYIAPTATSKPGSNDSTIIRISFSSPLHDISVSHCIYQSSENGSDITLVILDKMSRIYRITFPDPRSRVDKGLNAYEWNVKNIHVGWLAMSEPDMVASGMTLTGDEPMVWHVVDEDNLIIAVRDGMIRCSLIGDDWTHEYFRRPSTFRVFRTDPASFTRVVSFTHDPVIETVYAVTRDKKLRIWNAQTLAHESVIDLAQTSSIEEPRRSGHDETGTPSSHMPSSSMVRTIQGTKDTPYSKFIVTFTPTPRSPDGAGYFSVFGSNGVIKKDLELVGFVTCSSQTPGMDFRGFHVELESGNSSEADENMEVEGGSSTWRLWAAWDLKGRPVLEWTEISALFEPKEEEEGAMASNTWNTVLSTKESIDLEPIFDATYFDALNEGIEDGSMRPELIARHFVDHLFYPGRFSQSVLAGALADYIATTEESIEEDESESRMSLKNRIEVTVGRHLLPPSEDHLHVQEQVELGRRFKLEWQAFWIAVQQQDIQARWPISLATFENNQSSVDGNLPVVLCREGLVVPVVEDDIALIRRLLVNNPEEEEEIEELEAVPDAMEKKEIKELLQAPASTLEKTHPGLADAQNRTLLIEALASASMLARSIHPADYLGFQSAASTASSIVELMETVSDDLQWRVVPQSPLPGPFGKYSDQRRAFHTTLDVLMETLKQPIEESAFDTFTGLSLKVATMHQVIAARQLVAGEILLMACFILFTSESGGELSGPDNVYFSITERALAIFASWEGLRRLSERDADQARLTFVSHDGSTDETQSAAFMYLRKERNRGDDTGAVDETAYSLLHAILADKAASKGPKKLSSLSLRQSTFRGLRKMGLVHDNHYHVAGPAEVALAMDILLSGNFDYALEFAEEYLPAAGLMYVASRAMILAGQDTDVAVKGFNHVASAVAQPNWAHEDSSGLSDILPDHVRWNGLARYYKHVYQICRTADLSVPAMAFAKKSILETADATAAQDLMRYVFQEYLSTQQYEQAWQAMLANPLLNHDSTEEESPLSIIIQAMCRDGEAHRLFTLPISGMEGYIEDELDLRARTADPLAAPFYHKILYSWLIMRQDYRKAALTQCQYADRIKLLTAKSADDYRSHLVFRSRSLLAASNSLSLVEPENAWFTTHTTGRTDSGEPHSKRLRVSSRIPTSEYTQGIRRPIDIVTIDHIKREADLVLRSLTISQHTGSDLDPAAPLTADDCIAMLSDAGLFDQAFASSDIQQADKTVVFEYLVTRCIEMTGMSDEAIRDIDLAPWLDESSVGATWHGSLPEKAWKYLDVSLQRHDVARPASKNVWSRNTTTGTNFTYHLAVLHKILEIKPDLAVPHWLVSRLVERCPDDLIRAGLRVGSTVKAAAWAEDCLKRAQMQQPKTVGDGVIAPQYSPFNAIDQVIASGKDSEDQSIKMAVGSLQTEVDRRFRGIKSLMSTLKGV